MAGEADLLMEFLRRNQSMVQTWERLRETQQEELKTCKQKLKECENERDELKEQLHACQLRAQAQRGPTPGRKQPFKRRLRSQEEEQAWWRERCANLEKTVDTVRAALDCANATVSEQNDKLNENLQTQDELNEKLKQSKAEVRDSEQLRFTLQKDLREVKAAHLECRQSVKEIEATYEREIYFIRKAAKHHQELLKSEMATAQRLADEKQKVMQETIDTLTDESNALVRNFAWSDKQLTDRLISQNDAYVRIMDEMEKCKARAKEAEENLYIKTKALDDMRYTRGLAQMFARERERKRETEREREATPIEEVKKRNIEAEIERTIEEEKEMDHLKAALYVREKELAFARDAKSTTTVQMQEQITALQNELYAEKLKCDEQKKQLAHAQARLDSERPSRTETARLRSQLKVKDAKIQNLQTYLERFKSDVHHCISTVGDAREFRLRYSKLRARYIDCTDRTVPPECICSAKLEQLEVNLRKAHSWMERYRAYLVDCMPVIWNSEQLKQKVIAINKAMQIEDPGILSDNKPGVMQDFEDIEAALKERIQSERKNCRKFMMDVQRAEKKTSAFLLQFNEQRMEIVALQDELLTTRRQLEKVIRPVHKKVQSWFSRKVLKKLRPDQAGPEPSPPSSSSALEDYFDQNSATTEDSGSFWGSGGSTGSPGESPGGLEGSPLSPGWSPGDPGGSTGSPGASLGGLEWSTGGPGGSSGGSSGESTPSSTGSVKSRTLSIFVAPVDPDLPSVDI